MMLGCENCLDFRSTTSLTWVVVLWLVLAFAALVAVLELARRAARARGESRVGAILLIAALVLLPLAVVPLGDEVHTTLVVQLAPMEVGVDCGKAFPGGSALDRQPVHGTAEMAESARTVCGAEFATKRRWAVGLLASSALLALVGAGLLVRGNRRRSDHSANKPTDAQANQPSP